MSENKRPDGITIEVVIGDVRKVAFFSGGAPETTLTDLRGFLTGRQYLKAGDQFVGGSATVDQRDERAFTIEQVGRKKDSTWTIEIFRKTSTHKKPDEPQYPGEPTTGPIDKKKPGTDDHTTGVVPTGTAASSVRDHYNKLGPDRKSDLFTAVNLYRGFTPRSDGVWFAPKDGCRLKVEGALPEPTFVQETYKEDHRVSYHHTEHEVDKRVSNAASVSGSGWGVSAKSEYSRVDQSHHASSKTHLYLYSEYLARKIFLTLEPRDLQLVEELGARLEGLAAGGSFDAWMKILDEWGAYFGTEVTVGGKLFLEDERELDSSVDQTSVETKFKTAASGAFASFSASAAYSHGEKTDVSQVTVDQNRTVKLRAFGGEEGKVHNPPEWVASLGPADEWKNCKITRMIPIYELASDDAKGAIRNLMVENRVEWRESQYDLAIDYEAYLRPLDRFAADEFE